MSSKTVKTRRCSVSGFKETAPQKLFIAFLKIKLLLLFFLMVAANFLGGNASKFIYF